MIERKNIETAHGNCNISVVTEQMEAGRWGAAVRIVHHVGDVERIIPVELPDRRFETEEAARAYAVDTAQRWIDENMPRGS